MFNEPTDNELKQLTDREMQILLYRQMVESSRTWVCDFDFLVFYKTDARKYKNPNLMGFGFIADADNVGIVSLYINNNLVSAFTHGNGFFSYPLLTLHYREVMCTEISWIFTPDPEAEESNENDSVRLLVKYKSCEQ